MRPLPSVSGLLYPSNVMLRHEIHMRHVQHQWNRYLQSWIFYWLHLLNTITRVHPMLYRDHYPIAIDTSICYKHNHHLLLCQTFSSMVSNCADNVIVICVAPPSHAFSNNSRTYDTKQIVPVLCICVWVSIDGWVTTDVASVINCPATIFLTDDDDIARMVLSFADAIFARLNPQRQRDTCFCWMSMNIHSIIVIVRW